MGQVRGVLLHHTATGNLKDDAPSIQMIMTTGRVGLTAPLANIVLARSGTYHLVAAGSANHAGKGEWQGVVQGNHQLIGVEMENTGLDNDPWPDVQYEAALRGTAAMLKHINAKYIMAASHAEYALPPGRKIDPSRWDMDAFRTKLLGVI
jgi:hypothetical protein